MGTRTPVALPVVRIRIDETGAAAVTVDHEPYDTPTEFGRGDVRRLVQDLAEQHGPIRVEISEADGETYVDIEAPRDQHPAPSDDESSDLASTRRGRFSPGEAVLVAVVVGRSTAGFRGEVILNLPPGLLLRHRDDLMLIGEASHNVEVLTDPEHRSRPA